jgi:hypothetical protein
MQKCKKVRKYYIKKNKHKKDFFFKTTILDTKSELWYINKFIQIDKTSLTYSQATKCFSKKIHSSLK